MVGFLCNGFLLVSHHGLHHPHHCWLPKGRSLIPGETDKDFALELKHLRKVRHPGSLPIWSSAPPASYFASIFLRYVLKKYWFSHLVNPPTLTSPYKKPYVKRIGSSFWGVKHIGRDLFLDKFIISTDFCCAKWCRENGGFCIQYA